MKTKFSHITKRSFSVLLSVLMMLSCLTIGLTSTSAAEIASGTSASDTSGSSSVAASATDNGTVAAAAEDDGAVAASTDSGTVAASETSEEVGSGETVYLLGAVNNSKPSDLSLVNSLSATVDSNGKATFTIPQDYFSISASYYFAISSSNEYKGCYWQTESYQTGVVTVGADGSAFSGAKENEYGLRADETGNDRWLDWHYAHVYVNTSKLGGNVTLTVDTSAKSYTFAATDATIGEYTINATVADGQSDYGSVTPTSNKIKYGDSAITFTATANTGYTFKSWSLSDTSNLTLSTNGAVAYITAKATTGGTATLTATFEADSSYTPPATGDNIYTATLAESITGNGDLYTGVKATFYDYFYDSEVTDYPTQSNQKDALNSYWLTSSSKINTDANVTGNESGMYPFTTLNKHIATYASSSGNVAYPLYFGAFWQFCLNSGSNTSGLYGTTPSFDGTTATNWSKLVNDSNPLTNYFTSVTGLAGSTLGSNGEIYHATSSGTNGAEMEVFNADWLTNGDTNGSGSALGAVVTSDFPVRKTTKSYESNKIYVDTTGCSWYEDGNCVLLAYFWDSCNTSCNYWVQMKKTTIKTLSGSGKYLWCATIPDNCDYVAIERADEGVSWDTNSKTWDKIDKISISSFANVESDNRVIKIKNEYLETETLAITNYKTVSGTTTYYEFSSNGAKDNVYFTKSTNSSGEKSLVLNYGTGYDTGVKGCVAADRSSTYSYGYFPFDSVRGSSAVARDFGFGTKFDIDFTIGTNGQINGVDQIFEYSGDDDLWVYIDGKLVLDLGGDHKMSTGSINFATGVVTADFAETASGGTSTQTTLQSALGSDYNQNPNTVHTLTIYYLERGMNESNLKIGFNFEPVGNEFDVTNTVNTTQVNSGLVSAVENAINSSSSFNYAITPENNTVSYAYADSKTTNGSGTGTSPKVTGTSANVVYVDQFTKGDKMTVTQTNTSGYAFTTTNSVNDIETGVTITPTTAGSNGTETGTFSFTRSDGKTGDLAVTHLSADYVNEVQVGSLTVGKEITNYGDADTEFTLYLEIKLPDTNDYAVYSGVTYVKSDGSTGTLGTDGTFKLKCYETATFYGIPLNSYVKVYESCGTNGSKLYAFDGYVASSGLKSCGNLNYDEYSDYGVSAELTGSTNTLTINNRRRTYRVEYLVPTRLYGQTGTSYWNSDSSMDYENCKVYAFTGYVDDTNFTYGAYRTYSTTSEESMETYGVNFSGESGVTNLIVNMLPYEDVFDQTIAWSESDIDQYVYYAGNTTNCTDETTYDVVASWVPTVEEFSRYVNAVVSVNDTTLNFFGTGTSTCNAQCTYGTLLASTDESTMTGLKDTSGNTISLDLITSCKITDAVGNYTTDDTAYFITAPATNSSGESFLYWKVEKMNNSGANTGKEVTRCYTRRFAYTMYDNYYITAEYGTKGETTSQSSYGSASAYIIDITRSQWNDTVAHANDTNQSYSSASTSYDRVYIDFELAYNYQGIQLKNYSGTDIKVGFDIYASNGSNARYWTRVATQEVSLSELDNKNRIEYYYGLKNTSAKAGYKYAIVPYISVNGTVVNYTAKEQSNGENVVKYLSITGGGDFSLASNSGYTTVYDTFGGTDSTFANICNAAAGTMPAYNNTTTESDKIANDPTIKDKANSAQS